MEDKKETTSRPRPGTSASSTSSKETWMTTQNVHRMGKGVLLYTGPEGKRQQRVHVEPEHRGVGIGTYSREQTSELLYLCRAPEGVKFAEQMAKKPGAIGWGIPPKGDPRKWPVHMKLRSEEEMQESFAVDQAIYQRR
ncbi:uncharacterized protein LOC129257407 [Lytechinus pictus]|uniref:uncharacterized protein LOC129257407 n=1 Tax=Lytechinus pictus TaxID=7653 RepID=UPI00240DD598|nr:uncharacterized protein LOC129257407 [Lytechinus pictus]